MPFIPDDNFEEDGFIPDPDPITPAPKKSIFKSVGGFLGDVTGITGAAKAVGTAFRPKTLSIAGRSLLGKGVPLEEFNNIPDISAKQSAGSFGKLGLTVGTFGTGGLATGLAARAVESGIMGATFQALDNLEQKEKVSKNLGTAALIGGAIPVAGRALSGSKRILGKATEATGKKIQQNVIAPKEYDFKDGFKLETINKYNLGGSLKTMATKTETKIKSLGTKLKSILQETGDVEIDLSAIAQKTRSELLAGRASNFGEVGGIRRAMSSLEGEIADVAPTGRVGLLTAQEVKQAAGRKGSWVFGNPDPDARAVEKVYTSFYRKMREEIEKTSPPGIIREINKQLSELIPVNNAIIRRIPVADRQSLIGLPELIGIAGAAFNPASLSIIGLNKAAKSGAVGSALSKIGSRLKTKVEPRTNIGRRIFGR